MSDTRQLLAQTGETLDEYIAALQAVHPDLNHVSPSAPEQQPVSSELLQAWVSLVKLKADLDSKLLDLRYKLSEIEADCADSQLDTEMLKKEVAVLEDRVKVLDQELTSTGGSLETVNSTLRQLVVNVLVFFIAWYLFRLAWPAVDA